MTDSTPTCGKLRLIFGGTFDPIHWGHLRPALNALTWLQADELRLLPSAQPPHRDYPGATAAQRLTMTQLAAAAFPQVHADDWELQQDRPSYTVQTLAELKQRWPHDILVFLLGDDAIAKLNGWHQWQALLDHAHFAILSRPDQAADWQPEVTDFFADRWLTEPAELRQAAQGCAIRVANDTYPIAATTVRHRIQQQLPWESLVPPAVAAFIQTEGLYR
ncbi:nicotinate-nucleotide adenylyltransferase [Pseudidiomarina aestuarii]|uniref:nicotinate-nucleotide adenylyltransferase n=1 Tax=Pseudidiomarina aestuarii TaxID=624146 RepID=UPI003A9719EF